MDSVEHNRSGTWTSDDRSEASDRDGSSTADTLQHQAGRVTEEVRDQAVSLGQDARQQLHQQARKQTEHLGETLESVAERLHALADGRPDDAGQTRELIVRIADQVDTISRRFDELGFDGAVDEVQRFARQRPGVFLASAAAIGFAGSRLTQGAKANRENGNGTSSSGNGHASGQRATPDRGPDQSTAPLPPPISASPAVPTAVPPGRTPGQASGQATGQASGQASGQAGREAGR